VIGVETWKGHKEKENRGSHKKTFSLSLNLPSASVSLSCQFTRYTLVDACLYKLVACTHKYIERLPRTFHVAHVYYIDIATPRDSRSMIQSNAKVDRNKTLYHDLYRWPNEFQYDARITTYLLPAGIRIRAIWKARPVHHARRHEYRERAENSNMQSLFRTSSFRVLFKIICLIYAHIMLTTKPYWHRD